MAKCVRYDDHAGAGMEQRPEAETCEEAAVLTLATVQGGGGWRVKEEESAPISILKHRNY